MTVGVGAKSNALVLATEVIETAEQINGLSTKKQRLAQLLADPSCNMTIKELCEQENIAFATICKYLDDENFVSYVRQLIDKYSESSLAAVWGALIEKCKSGDMRAIKLYFELKGRLKGCDAADSAGVVITGSDDLE